MVFVDQNKPEFLQVLEISRQKVVRSIDVKERDISLFVDYTKIIALMSNPCIKIWDVNTGTLLGMFGNNLGGEFWCKIDLVYSYTYMNVINDKILLQDMQSNILVMHFDKPNMNKKEGILVVNPGNVEIITAFVEPCKSGFRG